MKIKNRLSEQKKAVQCIKVKEFQYTEGRLKRSSIRKVVNQNMIPIKTILQKMSSIPKIQEDQNIHTAINQGQQNKILRSRSLSYKKFITPRDVLFKPKPSVFNRFSYQNYENYQYKNPFKPERFKPDHRVMKVPEKDVKKGTTKNIQIVFCQKKFADFVQKANQKVTTFYSQKSNYGQNLSPKARQQLDNKRTTKKYAATQSLMRSQSLPLQKKLSQTYSGFGHTLNMNRHFSKTTLSKCMQQFNTLQKLSTFLQIEQKHNQKYLLNRVDEDSSKSVLLTIMDHRFAFLTKLRTKTKNLIYKSLLGCDKIMPYTKLSIHQYIRFLQLFVYRDASIQQLNFFVFNFLFQDADYISLQAAKTILDQLPGSSNKHSTVEEYLSIIIKSADGDSDEQRVFNELAKNQGVLHLIIDLIIDK